MIIVINMYKYPHLGSKGRVSDVWECKSVDVGNSFKPPVYNLVTTDGTETYNLLGHPRLQSTQFLFCGS